MVQLGSTDFHSLRIVLLVCEQLVVAKVLDISLRGQIVINNERTDSMLPNNTTPNIMMNLLCLTDIYIYGS
jgi:hypothetical protein